MKSIKPLLLLVLCASLFGAGGSTARLTENDTVSGEEGLKALQATNDDMLFTMTIASFGLMPMGRDIVCLSGLQRMGSVSPDTRSMYAVKALKACGYTCPKDLDRYGAIDPKQRMNEAIKECDKVGPDPLFTGELAAMRKDFNFMDYMLLRINMEHLAKAAQNTGGDRNAAVVKGFQDLAPRLAKAMKAQQAANLKAMGAQ